MKRFASVILAIALGISANVIASAEEINTYIEETVVDDIVGEEVIDDVNTEAVLVESEEIVDMPWEDSAIVLLSDWDCDFYAKVTADDYNLTISAAQGVFPNGTNVTVIKADDEYEKTVADNIQKLMENGESIIYSATFDFAFTDENGIEIEPAQGSVKIEVEDNDQLDEAIESAKNPFVYIYHVKDDGTPEEVDFVDGKSAAEDGLSFEAEEFSSYSIIVVNNNESDTKAPVIVDAVIKNSSYVPGSANIPTVSASVEDNMSGVSKVQMKFSCSAGGTTVVELKKNKDNYVGTVDVIGLGIGKYVLSGLMMSDKCGNQVIYSKSNMPSKVSGLYFTVVKRSRKFDVNIGATKFDLSSYYFVMGEQSKKIGLTMQASAEGQKIKSIDVVITKKNKDNTYSALQFPLKRIGKSDYYNGAAKFKNSNTYSGTWKIVKLTIVSTDGAMKILEHEEIPKNVQSQLLYVCTSLNDKSAPKIKSVKFAEQRVDIGNKTEKIKVELVTTKDPSGIMGVGVTLGNSKRSIAMRDIYIYGNKVTGYFYIPKNMPQGKYKIISAFVKDYADNTRYYGKNPGYTPFTDSMKQTVLEIRHGEKYDVVFNPNGGNGSMPVLKNKDAAMKYVLPANKFTRKGYTFSCWNTKKDGSGRKFADKATVTRLDSKSGKITMYARWKANSYSICFYGNGATTGWMDMQRDIKYGKTVALSANKYKRDGYTFAGWNTKADGSGKQYANKAEIKNLSSKNGSTVILYAMWK